MKRNGRKDMTLNANPVEDQMVDMIENLADFEDFRREVLPSLRKAIMEKTPAPEILKMVDAVAAGKLGSLLVTSRDENILLKAISMVLERNHGKTVDKKKIEHTFDELPDEQIDSLLETQIKKLQRAEERAKKH